MRGSHQRVLTQQATINENQEQQIVVNQDRGVNKFVASLFILVILLLGSFFKYQDYEEYQYQMEHLPKKQDVLKSQASKMLQRQQEQKNSQNLHKARSETKNDIEKQTIQKSQQNKQIGQNKSIKQDGTKQGQSSSILLFSVNNQLQKKQQSSSQIMLKDTSQNKNKQQLQGKNRSQELSIKNNQFTQKRFNNQNQQKSSIQPKQTFIYKLPTKPQLIIPPQHKDVTVVITTCCDRYDLLQKTLNSFAQKNTYIQKLKQLIVINDGPGNQRFLQMKKQWKNITWVETGRKVGHIQAIDLAYSMVKTEFVFHCQDDWVFLEPNFIQYSFDYFQRIPNLLQTWIKVTNQKVNEQTRIVESQAFGFSFNPGLKKMEHYRMIGKGYKWITKNISHGTGAGKAQGLISRYYKKKGLVVAQTEVNYVKHIGQGRGLPRAGY